MRIELGLSQISLRRWHVEAAERLAGIPEVAVGIRWTRHQEEQLPLRLTALLAIEQACLGVERAAPASAVDLSPYVGTGGTFPDLILDLTGTVLSAGKRNWCITFDGKPGEASLLRALHAGRAPTISIWDADRREAVSGRLFVLEADGLSENYEKALAEIVDLAVAAVRDHRAIVEGGENVALAVATDPRPRPSAARLIGAALARLALTPISALTSRGISRG